jgi:hypothetical protein
MHVLVADVPSALHCVQIRSGSESGFVQCDEQIVRRHSNSTLHSSHRKFIMNSFKKLLLTKSILAAAVAASGISASGIAAAATPVPVGGPSSGMSCRTGYTAAFDGTRLKCSKTTSIPIPLVCDRPNFPGVGNPPAPVIRASGAAGDNSNGKDLCPRTGLRIGTTDALTGLVQGTDYVFATADAAAVTTRTANNDQSEATALGLTLGEVDTLAGTPVITVNANGVTDRGAVTLTFFTFPISSGIVIGGPVGVPLPSNLPTTTTFAPRPLPR